MPEPAAWHPLRPADALEVLDAATFPWWVGGGHAIDLYAGIRPRPHDHLEIEMLRRDWPLACAALRGWDLRAVRRGRLRPVGLSIPPTPGSSRVWARPEGSDDWRLELWLAESEADQWVSRRSPGIQRSFRRLGGRTPDGVAYLAPEIVLSFASNPPTAVDEANLQVALPLMETGRRIWLREALRAVEPRHPWVGRLRTRRGTDAA